jgi:hypothetical protein
LNGAATAVGAGDGTIQAGLTGFNGLAFLNSTLYAVRNNATILYTLSTSTAAPTVEGNWGGTFTSAGDIAFVGGRLFLAADDNSLGSGTQDRVLELSLTGTILNTSADKLGSAGADGLKGLGSGGDGFLYLVAGTSPQIFKIDINTLTVVSGGIVNWQGASSFGSPGGMTESVPEPSVLTLSSIGVGLIVLSRIRRRKNS